MYINVHYFSTPTYNHPVSHMYMVWRQSIFMGECLTDHGAHLAKVKK